MGSATYLKKGLSDYIPFRLVMYDKNCDKMNKILNAYGRSKILFIDSEDK